MSDPRINDADSAGPGAEFVNPDGQDPATVSSGDSQTGTRSADPEQDPKVDPDQPVVDSAD